jgi:hypothetical protein
VAKLAERTRAEEWSYEQFIATVLRAATGCLDVAADQLAL